MTLPIRMGGVLVGRVEEVGAGITGLELGETVFGMGHTGAFAEYAAVKAANMVRVPSNLCIVQAAALPLAGSTAWQALFDEARLAEGQRLLITNSSGGVGSLAVQFAKAAGAHVTAVASARNEVFVRGLGADEFIDYTSQSFEQVSSGIDVVFDTVGGDTFERAFQVLHPGGFMVTVVAFPQDEAERYGVAVAWSFTLLFANIREALALSKGGRARGKIVLHTAD